ncbi:hypothetical protein PMAYCL1PPCAC_08596, partial [Pristionchus mayeri]
LNSELITVNTSRGSVQGFEEDFGNDTSQTYYGYGQVFLGIPFAKPPVGAMRFQLPEPISKYNDKGGVHNATYYRSRCWQVNFHGEMSDDCLYLNVITPNISGKHPVMVYIHGGSFTTGGADKYHWKGAIRNLASRGVVVVTIQYRIGLFGFFTTFTETFPPNRGMYDQILALRWVNEEIANFGGDTNRITIFGQSAGASSVSDLSLSPLARGLFHQLIQSSGSSMQEIEAIADPRWSIHKDRAQQICQINSTDWGSPEKDEEIIGCFLKADTKAIVSFDSDCLTKNECWNVAIDGAFLPDDPEILAESRPNFPVLIGEMLEDFALFIDGVVNNDTSTVNSQTNKYLFQLDWPNYDDEISKNISDIMIAGYCDRAPPAEDDHLGWTKLLAEINTGRMFASNIIKDVQWHRKAGNENVWLFTFAHRSLLPSPQIDIDGWIPVGHASELPFLWFYPEDWQNSNATNADLSVADYMGALWAHFVKHG